MKMTVIGGGLAGCEAACYLASCGHDVTVKEMRGVKNTPCHKTEHLAELVCSNSLKSVGEDTASGMLKAELELMHCSLLKLAYKAAVPAGGALAVDRSLFSALTEEKLKSLGVKMIRCEADGAEEEGITLIACGPMVSEKMAEYLCEKCGAGLHFYDAVAPIVSADSIDMEKAYFAARYDKGEADYLNCPMTRQEYELFRKELISAERAVLHDFEKGDVFEWCMPIEVLAARGEDAMRYGPLRPVGLRMPDGSKPYAVLQLRRENLAGDAYNLVGFQTNLKFSEQKRVFSLIPALAAAEYLRYGIMHRNTYVNAPGVMNADFSLKSDENVFVIGQLSGVEGYVESIASGLMGAINADRRANRKAPFVPPKSTICGALCRHITSPAGNYQPMNANFGILPPLDGGKIKDKKQRKRAYTLRGIQDMERACADAGL